MARIPTIKITFWRLVLAAMILVGLYATAVRFHKGLGAATNLSDAFPWGIWIGFDILCGVALAAGGFTLAAGVYVFRLDRYRPILRATILTAFLGYLMAIVSLLFDIGQPWRIWHPMVMGNEHSPMFEVALCVMLYTTVLALEFSPAVFEWLKLERPLRIIHMLTPPLVILGVLLSTLHQSTLGTLFVIVPGKVHGLWYTPLLPVLFYVSAIGVGIAMVIFESSMSHRAFGISLHDDILAGLGKAIVVVLSIYLALRFATIAARGSLGLILEGSPESRLFLLEILLGFVAPLILFANKRVRTNSHGRFYASLLVILGVVLNRLNLSTTATARYSNFSYMPSFLEASTTIFIIAAGMVAFGVIVRYLPIFPAQTEEEHEADSHGSYMPLLKAPAPTLHESESTIATPIGVAVLCGLVVLFLVFGYVIHPASTPKIEPRDVQAAAFLAASSRKLELGSRKGELRLPHDYTFHETDFSPGAVVFSHTTHVAYAAQACTNCHLRYYPMMTPEESNGTFHGNARMYGCSNCHNGKQAFNVNGQCALCHGRDRGRLPVRDDFIIPSLSSGVGSVHFSHKRHVIDSHQKCSQCHPRPYEMVKPGTTFGPIKDLNKRMLAGHQCSKCHNGEDAFQVLSNCQRCHAD